MVRNILVTVEVFTEFQGPSTTFQFSPPVDHPAVKSLLDWNREQLAAAVRANPGNVEFM